VKRGFVKLSSFDFLPSQNDFFLLHLMALSRLAIRGSMGCYNKMNNRAYLD